MSKASYIKIKLNWWQFLVFLVVLITVLRLEPVVAFEAIKALILNWMNKQDPNINGQVKMFWKVLEIKNSSMANAYIFFFLLKFFQLKIKGYFYGEVEFFEESGSSRERSEEWIWLSTDPLAEERPGISPYNYVQNNPLNRIDPTGMLDESVQRPDDWIKYLDTGEVKWFDGTSEEAMDAAQVYFGTESSENLEN